MSRSFQKALSRQEHVKLFGELVGKTAKKSRQCTAYKQFWQDLDKLREFRNGFVHGEPENSDREPKDIPGHIADVVHSVDKGIQPAFQELTNRALAHIGATS